jgi:hypothetical protein
LDGWQVTAGYVGVVRGSLPLTATAAVAAANNAATGGTCDINANLILDEVLITVAPTAPNTAAAAGGPSGSNAPDTEACTPSEQQQQQTFAEDLGMLGQIGVLEGIKLIAGGIEALLQRLSVAATNITIRVEVPPAAAAGGIASAAQTAAAASADACGAEIILHLESVHFCDATPADQQAAAKATAAAAVNPSAAAAAAQQLPPAVVELVKRVSVTGLTVELLQLRGDEAEGSAADGTFNSMRCSQLLYDDSADVAATAAALHSSFMGRSSMMHTRFMSSAAADTGACAGVGSGQLHGEPQAAAAVGSTPGMCPELGGLLFGGPNATGLDLKLELRLAWSTGGPAAAAASGASAQPPRITADINVSVIGVYLQPWQLPLMQLCSDACISSNSSSSTPSASEAAAAVPVSGSTSAFGVSSQQQQQWGQRSFVEDLFFPHVEGFVADSLNLGSPSRGSNWGPGSGMYNSVAPADVSSGSSTALGGIRSGNSSSSAAAAINAASGMYSMYHDARSVFSSVASCISGAVSGNMLNSMYSAASTAQGTTQQQQQQLSPSSMYSSSTVDGTGSVWQQQPMLPAAAWSMRAMCPSVYVCLYYHSPACIDPAGAPNADDSCTRSGTQQQQRRQHQQQEQQRQLPCFVVRCGGLSGTYDLSGRAHHVSVKVYQLEACEHLPSHWPVVAGQPAAAAAADGAGGSGAGGGAGGSGSGLGQPLLHPKVLGCVPRVLAVAQDAAGFTQQVGKGMVFLGAKVLMLTYPCDTIMPF